MQAELIQIAKDKQTEAMKMKNPRGNYPSCAGTTATVVLITDDKVICANAGDSRTVYGTGWNSDGKAGKGIPLS